MNAIIMYAHPDGKGCIEYDGGILTVSNDMDAVATRVQIGPKGMRDLATRLNGLADALDGGRAK